MRCSSGKNSEGPERWTRSTGLLTEPRKELAMADNKLASRVAGFNLGMIWNQQSHTPVVWRVPALMPKLHVRLPYRITNREWLSTGRRTAPVWDAENRWWVLPKFWFDDFVNRALHEFGRVYVIQPFREKEICALACRNAQGHICECSCMG
jgi:hypothetical protein